MSRPSFAAPRAVMTLALVAIALARPRPAAGQEHEHRPATDSTPIQVPQSVRAEHQEIHAELVRASKAPGRVGTAARELGTLLYPHFVREEQIALPPLGLFAPMAAGAEITPAMRAVLPLADSLRAELPRMLAEHAAIRAAVARLSAAAVAARDARTAEFAEKLARHARSEEELLYPAAVLAGDLLRARLAGAAGTRSCGQMPGGQMPGGQMPCAAGACTHQGCTQHPGGQRP